MLRWALVALLFVLVSPAVPTGAASQVAELEEYAVYAAVLGERWEKDGSHVVVRRETRDDASDDFDRTVETFRQAFVDEETSAPLLDALIESYRRIRRSNVQLDPERLDLPFTTVAPSKEIDAILNRSRRFHEAWEEFREHFDGARSIVRFSRVAFSADGTRAMVSVSTHCGALCGAGYYLFLQKSDGAWRVVASELTVIS